MSEGLCTSVSDATAYALNLLARREHSRRELATKLMRRQFDADAIEQALDSLERSNALSDDRFAEAYVDSRVQRGFGPLRISAELRERGVAEPDSWLRERYDWLELCAALKARRFGEQAAASRAEWNRQARFLNARGFPESVVRRVLGS